MIELNPIAYCSMCKKQAINGLEVNTNFGYRFIKGKRYLQSACKDCRRKHAKAVRDFKKTNPVHKDDDLRSSNSNYGTHNILIDDKETTKMRLS